MGSYGGSIEPYRLSRRKSESYICRLQGRAVDWVCGGAIREASCCAGDDLPEGMIWLRHELQLGLHELRCGALGVKPIAAPSESVGANPRVRPLHPSQIDIFRTVGGTKDPLVKGGRIAYKAIRGDSCRQYEFAESLTE